MLGAPNESEAESGRYYGMPFFHYDVVAKAVPGIVGVWLVWFFVLDARLATAAWNGILAFWLAQLAPLLVGYLLVGFLDAFMWWPVKQMTVIQWNHRNRHIAGKAKRKWSQVFSSYTLARTKQPLGPEFTMMEKAHVEARGLATIGAILILVPILSWLGG